MGMPVPEPRIYRFDDFTLEARTGELVRNGAKLALREQPLQLLLALLEQPGELVSREQLIARLWEPNTFVNFDRGLNKAINHLRETLGDSAEHPRFVETLPRKGYRFVGQLKSEEPAILSLVPALPQTPSRVVCGSPSGRRRGAGCCLRHQPRQHPHPDHGSASRSAAYFLDRRHPTRESVR
jgi:DNA-binding winged helix-turn-helix (wHTH) protein